MSQELNNLQQQLKAERKKLIEELNEIDNKLGPIEIVLNLLKKDEPKPVQKFVRSRLKKLAGFSFKQAVIIVLKESQSELAPKDISEALKKQGYKTKAKNFKATARNQLIYLRKSGEVNSRKTEKGYLYSHKEKDPVSHIDETGSVQNNGELGEGIKPAVL